MGPPVIPPGHGSHGERTATNWAEKAGSFKRWQCGSDSPDPHFFASRILADRGRID